MASAGFYSAFLLAVCVFNVVIFIFALAPIFTVAVVVYCFYFFDFVLTKNATMADVTTPIANAPIVLCTM